MVSVAGSLKRLCVYYTECLTRIESKLQKDFRSFKRNNFVKQNEMVSWKVEIFLRFKNDLLQLGKGRLQEKLRVFDDDEKYGRLRLIVRVTYVIY